MRRINPARPRSPEPNNSKDEGSGVAAVSGVPEIVNVPVAPDEALYVPLLVAGPSEKIDVIESTMQPLKPVVTLKLAFCGISISTDVTEHPDGSLSTLTSVNGIVVVTADTAVH